MATSGDRKPKDELMSVLRFLATLCVLIAVIALIADLTPVFAGTQSFALASFESHWKEVAPETFKALEASVSGGRDGPLWAFLVGPLLALPTVVLFALLALITGYLGRRRTRVKIYAN